MITNWKQIKKYPLEGFRENMENAIVLDGKNCYSIEVAELAGITYDPMGRRIVIADRNKLTGGSRQ